MKEEEQANPEEEELDSDSGNKQDFGGVMTGSKEFPHLTADSASTVVRKRREQCV